MIRRAVLASAWLMVACGRNEAVEVEQPAPVSETRETIGRGERLIGVTGVEEGGCPWSADADSQGRVLTIANSGAKAELHAFSLDSGKVLHRSLERPYTIVRHILGADELQAAHWWEDPATGAYGWRSAFLNMQGELIREEEKARDPFDRLATRGDGATLVMPHGGHYLKLQKSFRATPVQFFNARDLGYTIRAARFSGDTHVLSVGIAVHPLDTPRGMVGSEGRWVALVMKDTDGHIAWAKDLGIALPEGSEIALSLDLGDDAVFVSGGNTWNNNDARIHVDSFLVAYDLDGNELARQTFANADAPWMVVTENRARLVLPFKSPSLDWYQRSMEHQVIAKDGTVQHQKMIRGEGPEGIIVKRLLKANGVPVLVGCFYGQTQLGDHLLQGNADSGFVFQLDPRIEK